MENDKNVKLLLDFVNPLSESISRLNDTGSDGKSYPQQSLLLLLIFMDQLGWLTSSTEFSDGNDFKNWLNRYMDFTDLNCDANSLWIARCGLLHMGLPYNKGFKKEQDYQIAWYSNIKFTSQEIKNEESKYQRPTRLVNTNLLITRFQEAIFEFAKEVFENKELHKIVMEKLDKRPIHIRL